jgi:putative MATE family efflux protein
VAVQGTQYLGILLYGVFTMNVLIIATSALQGAGNAVLPMSVMILSNLVNAALDPVLIFGLLGFPKMGVRGAALATVVAQAVSAAVLLAAMGRGVGGLRLHRGTWRPDPGLQWRILRVGVPSSGQMLLRSLMGMVLMRIVASCGTAAVAAYGIVLRFHMILLFPAFTMGNAAATLVGQHLGAGNPRRAAGAAWTATGIEVALMCFLSLFAWCFAPGLIAAFAPDPHVVGTGAACLRIQSPFFVASAFAIVLGRCMQGAGDTVPPMVFTLLALWGLQVPLATWLAHVWKPPTDGIWWASALAQLAHGLMVTLWFATGRWKHKRV